MESGMVASIIEIIGELAMFVFEVRNAGAEKRWKEKAREISEKSDRAEQACNLNTEQSKVVRRPNSDGEFGPRTRL